MNAAPEGWEHATRDLADGTTIQHGDAVLVEATYTQSDVDRDAGKTLNDPHSPDDLLWLNVQGHAPVKAPLAAVHPAQSRLIRAIHESGEEQEVTLCTMTDDELDAALLRVGELHEALRYRRWELQHEMAAA